MTKLIAAVVITAILSSAATALATTQEQQPSVAPEQIDRLVCPAGYVITEEYGCVTPDELEHDATFWQNMQDSAEEHGLTASRDGSLS